MSVVDAFISNLSILKEAGTSLIVTRSREPYEVSSAVRDYVIGANRRYASINSSERLAYGSWNALDGLTIEQSEDLEFNTKSAPSAQNKKHKKTVLNGVKDITKVLQFFGNKLSAEETKIMRVPTEFPIGMYDLVWPQAAFEKDMAKAALLYLAEEFTTVAKCLVLIIPPHVTVPEELNDFCTYLDFDAPAASERHELIVDVLKNFKHAIFDDLSPIVSSSAAMTGFELRSSLAIAFKEVQVSGQPMTVEALAEKIMQKKIEIINRTEILELLPEGDITQIGGLDNVKAYALDSSQCYSLEAEEAGVDRPKGIALFGPPGCGKTAITLCFGNILNLRVLRFDISKILKKFVGESEGMARAVFSIIRSLGECVVFIDEADKVFSGSSDDSTSSGPQRRIMAMLLSAMEDPTIKAFWVIAANNTEHMPSEMLRKQRIDELFSVGLPTKTERRAVIRIHLKKRKQDPDLISGLEEAVTESRGFVSAEIESAVKEAIKHAFLRKQELTGELIVEQLKDMKPLAKAFPKQFDKMRDWAEQVARPASFPEKEEGLEAISLSSFKGGSTKNRKRGKDQE